ncbi:E3 ubiquitin-protein ligase PUB23-like [Hibiscus syriacus]|uniref:E3 ubiquitin-protein ligase PUB23-like n=1 Tax=Hibiscus syriacus TaxID=106335 RepID=A0A6A3BE62_HIBSY|nr:E3 ubiquitin-protein ligase PUB23-like [Hibiscus syriacus]
MAEDLDIEVANNAIDSARWSPRRSPHRRHNLQRQAFLRFDEAKHRFVTQDDVLYPHLTVTETLVFTALLRLPNSFTRQEKIMPEAVINQLGLDNCKDCIIGNSFSERSFGWERKRVSIGQEMLINPSLLLLDEPTSGLDSTTAQRIVSTLSKQAQPLYFGRGSAAMDYFRALICPVGRHEPFGFSIGPFKCLTRTVIAITIEPSTRSSNGGRRLGGNSSPYYFKGDLRKGNMIIFDIQHCRGPCRSCPIRTLWWQSGIAHLQDQIGFLSFFIRILGYVPSVPSDFHLPSRTFNARERTVLGNVSAIFVLHVENRIRSPHGAYSSHSFHHISYWMAGLKPTAGNFLYTLSVLFYVLASQGMGLAIGALVMNQKTRPFSVQSSCLCSYSRGYYIQHIPGFISWIKYISLSHYTYKLLLGLIPGGSVIDVSSKTPIKESTSNFDISYLLQTISNPDLQKALSSIQDIERHGVVLDGEIAAVCFKRGNFDLAAKSYENVCALYVGEGWQDLLAEVLPNLAECQRILNDQAGYLSSSVRLLSLDKGIFSIRERQAFQAEVVSLAHSEMKHPVPLDVSSLITFSGNSGPPLELCDGILLRSSSATVLKPVRNTITYPLPPQKPGSQVLGVITGNIGHWLLDLNSFSKAGPADSDDFFLYENDPPHLEGNLSFSDFNAAQSSTDTSNSGDARNYYNKDFEQLSLLDGKIEFPDWASDVTSILWIPICDIDDKLARGGPAVTNIVEGVRTIALKLEFGVSNNQIYDKTIALHFTDPFHVSIRVADLVGTGMPRRMPYNTADLVMHISYVRGFDLTIHGKGGMFLSPKSKVYKLFPFSLLNDNSWFKDIYFRTMHATHCRLCPPPSPRATGYRLGEYKLQSCLTLPRLHLAS